MRERIDQQWVKSYRPSDMLAARLHDPLEVIYVYEHRNYNGIKPDRPDEMERVEAAGGRVINWNGYRVLRMLATSRSIGDQYFKPHVISVPEVARHCRNGQIGRTFANSTKESDAAKAAAVLAELAMAQGSKDNISVVVIELSKSS
ncbi:hypothetical protein IFM89_002513 [Coptis chinensis]|uniref:PPM-type phosphatase domain-containing protein n=1 Tax=Coptis chinensis TaxID=261450 RepID=A0A835LM54_9MAGN|nr:hypothetical protein IFM89_002513 [Coptis chinensis]